MVRKTTFNVAPQFSAVGKSDAFCVTFEILDFFKE